MSHKAKILIADLEVSTLRVETEVYALRLKTPYLNHQDITRDYAIHGAAWKWLGDDKTHCISVSPQNPFNDDAVVKALYDVICEADIIVGHNLDKFDIRKLNTRALVHGLPPIHKIITIDTLKIARKYLDLPSNSLAYIAKMLNVGIEKDESPDWKAIRAGDREALAYMRQYNKRDVEVTERVYLKLRSYDQGHPRIDKIQDLRDIAGNPILCCSKCGGVNLVKNGYHFSKSGVKKLKFKCKQCGGSTSQR